MPDHLELRIDKFIFKVAIDRLYSADGVWVKVEDPYIRIGVSDYLQGRNGDVAFVEVRPKGTEVASGEELAVIETIKVNIGLCSPLTGKVIETNPAMAISPEIINQDPYGDGWLAVIDAVNWEADRKVLMDPQEYFIKIKLEAEGEVNKK